MTKKHINCHCINGDPMTPQRWEHNARWTIKRLWKMLEDFADEEKFEEYEEMGIHFGVGTETEDIVFSPESWDMFQEMAECYIAYTIESYELERFPFYKRMFDSLCAQHKTTTFVY